MGHASCGSTSIVLIDAFAPGRADAIRADDNQAHGSTVSEINIQD